MKLTRNSLDILFSKYIRAKANWRCERCGSTPSKRGLHTHHFIRRRYLATRWDEDNAVALCYGCHQYLSENKDAEVEFMKQRLGHKLDWLQARSRSTKPDLNAIRLYLQLKLKELKSQELDKEPEDAI